MNPDPAGDPFVVIRHGSVDNHPSVPVLDLQFMEGYPFDAAVLKGAQETLRLARALGLRDIVSEIESFLNKKHPSGRRKR